MHGSDDPVLVEVTRGAVVESRHRGAAAVVDAGGALLAQWGDVTLPVMPRSAVKPIQALPLLETGAAQRFGLEAADIALACASHNGEARHVARVAVWLARLGLTVDDLECGAHAPRAGTAEADELVRAARPPSALHNNCSGKHAGFLSVALQLGVDPRGYIQPDHLVQRHVREALETMCDCALGAATPGVDGCGIPVYGIALTGLARAMARLVQPAGLAHPRRRAAEAVTQAMIAEPFMVAGGGRLCTDLIAAAGGAAIVKTGAEGVCLAALPESGLGIALKIDDGATRGAEVAVAALLHHFGTFGATFNGFLERACRPVIHNVRGVPVGRLRPAVGWLG